MPIRFMIKMLTAALCAFSLATVFAAPQQDTSADQVMTQPLTYSTVSDAALLAIANGTATATEPLLSELYTIRPIQICDTTLIDHHSLASTLTIPYFAQVNPAVAVLAAVKVQKLGSKAYFTHDALTILYNNHQILPAINGFTYIFELHTPSDWTVARLNLTDKNISKSIIFGNHFAASPTATEVLASTYKANIILPPEATISKAARALVSQSVANGNQITASAKTLKDILVQNSNHYYIVEHGTPINVTKAAISNGLFDTAQPGSQAIDKYWSTIYAQ